MAARDDVSSVFDTVKLFFYERFSNPLITSFCLSWVLWNYRFFMIVFSEESISSKTFELEELYLTPTKFFFFNCEFLEHIPATYSTGFLYPLTTALLYIYFVPSISRKVVLYHYTTANRTKKEILEAQGEQVIDASKARELTLKGIHLEEENEKLRNDNRASIKAFRNQLEEVEAKLNEEINFLTARNASLSEELEASKKIGQELLVENEKLKLLPKDENKELGAKNKKSPNLNNSDYSQKLQLKALIEIGNSPNTSRNNIRSLANLDTVERDFIIDELLANEYIEVTDYNDLGNLYSATRKGRRHLVISDKSPSND